MSVTIRIDVTDTVKSLDALARSQLPFALAKAITQTGLDFQKAERARFASIFTERRKDFLEREGVKLLGGIATKARPSITFGVTARASFLDKFELGGPRPHRSPDIAIPVDVRTSKSGIIPRRNRPRALLSNRAHAGAGGVFILKAARGKLAPGIYQRLGRKGRGGVQLLFALEQTAKIKPTLEFEKTFEATVKANWQKNFADALALAMRTIK